MKTFVMSLVMVLVLGIDFALSLAIHYFGGGYEIIVAGYIMAMPINVLIVLSVNSWLDEIRVS